MARLGGGPDRVAKAIERALARRRAPTRIKITPSARLMIAHPPPALGSDLGFALMRRLFPQPR